MNRNEQQIASKIREHYTDKERTELDTLRELDRKVKRPANVFAYTFGSISAIIMGAGMSLVMTDIGATLGIASAIVPGIVIGAIGMVMALVNYPIHKAVMKARKKKYAGKILDISNNIINNNN